MLFSFLSPLDKLCLVPSSFPVSLFLNAGPGPSQSHSWPAGGLGFTLPAAESFLGATQEETEEEMAGEGAGQRLREVERDRWGERQREKQRNKERDRQRNELEENTLRDTERWTYFKKRRGWEKGKQKEGKAQVEK